jgi:hypothetical protein
VADGAHMVAQMGFAIDVDFFYLLIFLFQQPGRHDAVGAESGAVHFDLGHE